MAPAFLDFMYQVPWKERVAAGPNSVLNIADPYSEPGGPAGREVHDFFGSPPLPGPADEDASDTAGAAGSAASGLAGAAGAAGAAGLAKAL
mmetsp:Transcript_34185/g.71142  ORF Transcript_34185/g.71142 Transcript_34185/m.71142 type:complete len:91 (+) Transcript_34185:3-275(+)